MPPSCSSSHRGGGGSYGYRHTVVVPTSREGAIVFPTNKTTGKIDATMYQPMMTQNMISTEEIATFLQGMEVFVKPVFKSDLIAFIKVAPWVFMLVVIVLTVLLIGSLMGFIKTSIPFYQVSVIISLLIVLWAAFMSVLNCILIKHVKKKIQEAKEKVQPYLQQWNGAFQARGYYWVAPANFPYWIELWTANTNQPMPGMLGVVSMGFNTQQQYMMAPQQQTPNYNSYGVDSQFNSPLQSYSPA